MMGNFERNENILQDIKLLCEKNKEEALSFYCDCLIELNRAYDKINQTEMLLYVKMIMAPAFPLVITHFANRVEAYLDEQSEKQKAKIRQDIEESVVDFSEVFKEIIHSTNGVDRMLFQSAPIDIGIRYAAPKLCAYYSGILNYLAELFAKKDGGKYAFCVYPTQISSAEAELLFSTFEERGKVCIIRIPGYKIACIRYLRQLLFHEFFHIQPGSLLRLRKERAEKFCKILFYSIVSYLYDGCDLSSEEKQQLSDELLGAARDEITAKLVGRDYNDRTFYSRELEELYVNIVHKHLCAIQKRDFKSFFDTLHKYRIWDSYEDYHKEIEKSRKRWEKIQNNLQDYFVRSMLTETCRVYMNLFREPYSDIMTIITLRITPLEYFSGFHYIPNTEEERHNRVELYFRVLFVAEALSASYSVESTGLRELLCEWSKWEVCAKGEEAEAFVRNTVLLYQEYKLANERKEVLQYDVSQESEEGNNIQRDAAVLISMNTEMKEFYTCYFNDCCQKYLEYEDENKEELDKFRRQFSILQETNSDELDYAVSIRSWENTEITQENSFEKSGQ